MLDNAFYHAEVTVLLRAAKENGGALDGRNMDVVIDKPMCINCEKLLPYIGLELGNPTVTFTDFSGRAKTMRNGKWDDQETSVGKRAYFDMYWGCGWPEPKDIEHYFLDLNKKERWLFETGNDSAALMVDGADGTQDLDAGGGRVNIRLGIWGHAVHGMLLTYEKVGGSYRDVFLSKGDLNRLREWVRSMHGDPLPVGLFIPYERAWIAVKEFMETDGMRSSGIEWISAEDLPANTFPDRFKMPKE